MAEELDLLHIVLQIDCIVCSHSIDVMKEDVMNHVLVECEDCGHTTKVEKENVSITIFLDPSFISVNKVDSQEDILKKKRSAEFRACLAADISNTERGKRFETFCKGLLDTVQEFRFKERDVRTKTSEIDLIYECFEQPRELVIQTGYFIVQCKNENKPTDVDSAKHLFADIAIKNLRFGILISANFLSANTKEFIKQSNIKEILILYLDKEDLEKYNSCVNVKDLLYQRYYEINFKI